MLLDGSHTQFECKRHTQIKYFVITNHQRRVSGFESNSCPQLDDDHEIMLFAGTDQGLREQAQWYLYFPAALALAATA